MNMIHSISCLGYRGFSTRQILNLAIPNGTPGSGLTVLVGPNGGGKSSIVECFNKISLARKNVSFSKGKRNLRAGDLVEIAITSDEGQGSSYHLLAIISTTRISWEQMQGLVSLRKII